MRLRRSDYEQATDPRNRPIYHLALWNAEPEVMREKALGWARAHGVAVVQTTNKNTRSYGKRVRLGTRYLTYSEFHKARLLSHELSHSAWELRNGKTLLWSYLASPRFRWKVEVSAMIHELQTMQRMRASQKDLVWRIHHLVKTIYKRKGLWPLNKDQVADWTLRALREAVFP